MFTERTQVLLSPEQRRALERLAKRRKASVGAVVRDAIEAYLTPGAGSRSKALEALLAIEAPVADWEIMKAEIEQGALS
ncbi:MAG: ribbon-helix-helix protein, CopG family [Acidobacteria bacterium]|nr:ribbon-helix-helix protein, CopG family [Acidobacteriota bacterium]